MIHKLHCCVCSNCVCVYSQGQIVVIKELDYEISNGHYVLTVTATDQCPIPQFRLTSSTTVSSYLLHTGMQSSWFLYITLTHCPVPQVLVNVVDVNDNAPIFTRPFEGPFEIPEGQPGPRVWTVKATDADSGSNGKVEYSITTGDLKSVCVCVCVIDSWFRFNQKIIIVDICCVFCTAFQNLLFLYIYLFSFCLSLSKMSL